jgi:pimeloyl-ACP methyl ester carboxylesterase
MPSKTVVFIHGNFVNYESWNPWVSRYEAKGYHCIAIPYPLRDHSVADLRRMHPDPKLERLGLDEVFDHHVRIIQGLSEKPILIGHSFGGLLTQLLVNRDLAAAGVAVDSVPPMGVLSFKWSFLKSAFPILNPLNRGAYLMPFEHFQYMFVNGMSLEAQQRAYDDAVVPESLRLSRGGLSRAARVDYQKPHAPLLLIAGEIDHIIPASLNRANYNRYQAGSSSVVDFKEFPGRNHYGLAAPGWEELADYALNWVEQQLGIPHTRETLESDRMLP